jgi:peptidoglycan/LPS O-acetylase OafA/YrhL
MQVHSSADKQPVSDNMPGRMQERDHNLYLDWLRAAAALLVLVTHVRGGFYVKWSDLDPASQTHLNYALFFITRLGREAVVIFFVLSGYLVGGQALGDFREGTYSIKNYLIARIARLHTVIVPALVLTALIDAINWPGRDSAHAQAFVVNLLFLQTLLGPAFGSNAALWSVAYEWWFYVIFGLVLHTLAASDRRHKVLAGALLVAIVIAIGILNPAILFMLPLWIFGCAVSALPPIKAHRGLLIGVALTALAGAIAISSLRWDMAGDFLVGVACALLIYAVKGLRAPKYAWFGWGTSLAAFSFSLYVIHYPINHLLQTVLLKERGVTASPAHWAVWLILVLGLIGAAYLFYLAFEQHAPLIRRKIRRVAEKLAGTAARPVPVDTSSSPIN